jgi:hypothetical protein
MGFLLIILILFLLYMNYELFGGYTLGLKSNYYHESFSEESYPIGEGNYFNPNSRSNDYFYDRTGMKGSVFIDVVEGYDIENTKENTKENNPPTMHQLDMAYKLELYPLGMYTSC